MGFGEVFCKCRGFCPWPPFPSIIPYHYGQNRDPEKKDYYPEAQVYFDPARRLYFFMQANRWAARATLPPELSRDIGPPVTVELDSDQPYDHHDEVQRNYPHHEERRHRGGYDEGFDEGYQQGYNEGYNEGYNTGYKASFEQAYRDGYQACIQNRDKDNRRWRDRDRR